MKCRRWNKIHLIFIDTHNYMGKIIQFFYLTHSIQPESFTNPFLRRKRKHCGKKEHGQKYTGPFHLNLLT